MPIRKRGRVGDFLRVCDRTGFTDFASCTMREWTGQIVRSKNYERRHPQDFVRGRRDDQTVDNARPPGVNQFIGPLVTEVAVAADAGDTSIDLDTTSRMEAGDKLSITLSSLDVHEAIIQEISDENTLVLTAPLPEAVEVGARVVDKTAISAPDIG